MTWIGSALTTHVSVVAVVAVVTPVVGLLVAIVVLQRSHIGDLRDVLHRDADSVTAAIEGSRARLVDALLGEAAEDWDEQQIPPDVAGSYYLTDSELYAWDAIAKDLSGDGWTNPPDAPTT